MDHIPNLEVADAVAGGCAICFGPFDECACNEIRVLRCGHASVGWIKRRKYVETSRECGMCYKRNCGGKASAPMFLRKARFLRNSERLHELPKFYITIRRFCRDAASRHFALSDQCPLCNRVLVPEEKVWNVDRVNLLVDAPQSLRVIFILAPRVYPIINCYPIIVTLT